MGTESNKWLSSLFGSKDSNPNPDVPVETAKLYIYKIHTTKKKDDENLTGWERVKKIFETDMYGESSPELERCYDTILFTVLAGAFIGGVGRSRVAYQNFFRSNMHTAFESPSKAKAKLQETVLMGMGSGAFRIGWRVGVFSSVYSIGSTCFTAYRGKSSVFDPAVGGAAAGFIYKFRDGPRLSLAGAVIGGMFGLLGGGLINGVLALAGTTQDELLSQQREAVFERRQKELEQLQASRKPEENKVSLDQFHSEILNTESEAKESNQPTKPNTSSTTGTVVDVSNLPQTSSNETSLAVS